MWPLQVMWKLNITHVKFPSRHLRFIYIKTRLSYSAVSIRVDTWSTNFEGPIFFFNSCFLVLNTILQVWYVLSPNIMKKTICNSEALVNLAISIIVNLAKKVNWSREYKLPFSTSLARLQIAIFCQRQWKPAFSYFIIAFFHNFLWFSLPKL